MNRPTRSQPGTGVLKRVWQDYLVRRAPFIGLAAFFMLIDGGSLGLLVWYIKPLIDEVFVAADGAAIAPIAGLIFAIFAARAIAAFIQRSMTAAIGLRVVADMQSQLSEHLMSLDGRFFHHHSPGNLLERVRGDTQTLQSISSNALIVIGRDVFSLLSLVIAAMLIDWRWTLIAFAGLPLLALPVNLLHKIVRRSTLKARLAAADLSTRLDEIFHGIKAIKANRMEAYEAGRAQLQIEDFRRRNLQAEQGKAALPSIVDLVAGLGFVAVMVYGGQQIVSGDKTLGDFMAFFGSLALLFDPIRRLAGVGGQLQAAKVSLERIYELFDQQPMLKDAPNAQPLTHPHADIELRDVNFGYGSDQTVLNGLNLIAEAGKVTAIVGPSGAGKSTLFNLLSRFEEPRSGDILIGGQSLAGVTQSSLRDNIALVTQETALFDESVFQNILYGRPNASEEEVLAAARHALVLEFVDSLPEGIHSACGPRGSNLSGGQRQRVVIARALLRNAPILLLDEATSALDGDTEKRIQAAIDEALQGRTALVIAHRLSTVKRAHCIYVLSEGRVAEMGNHEQLLARGGVYAAMCATLAH